MKTVWNWKNIIIEYFVVLLSAILSIAISVVAGFSQEISILIGFGAAFFIAMAFGVCGWKIFDIATLHKEK